MSTEPWRKSLLEIPANDYPIQTSSDPIKDCGAIVACFEWVAQTTQTKLPPVVRNFMATGKGWRYAVSIMWPEWLRHQKRLSQLATARAARAVRAREARAQRAAVATIEKTKAKLAKRGDSLAEMRNELCQLNAELDAALDRPKPWRSQQSRIVNLTYQIAALVGRIRYQIEKAGNEEIGT